MGVCEIEHTKMKVSVKVISSLNQTSIEWFLARILGRCKEIFIRRNLSLLLNSVLVVLGSQLRLTVINDCADNPLKGRDSLL